MRQDEMGNNIMNKQSKEKKYGSKNSILKNKSANPGHIKRILNWIAKGAAKPEIGGNSCHT